MRPNERLIGVVSEWLVIGPKSSPADPTVPSDFPDAESWGLRVLEHPGNPPAVAASPLLNARYATLVKLDR
jgi:hypothetical protein